MITQRIDQGWGPEHPLKQMEMEIVHRYLRSYREDSSRTVMINSTWYDDDLHQRAVHALTQQPADRVVLISMLDGAIAQPQQFQSLAQEVHAIGYYPGKDYIDFWSLVVDRYMALPGVNLLDERAIDCAFMCLNRKPHWHRVRLYQLMAQFDLLDQGMVSMGGDQGLAKRLLPQDSGESELAPNGARTQYGIANDIATLGHAQNWQRHFLNIVTETQYDVSKTTFVTEKIYKPILGLRPFLVYAPDGAQAWLDQWGFQHYTQDFQDITNLDLGRPESLVPFLQVLGQQGPGYWRQKYIDLRDKILYNRQQFDRHVARQIDKIQRGIHA